MINLTIATMTLRGLFGRKRFLLLLPLPVLMLGLALLAEALGAQPSEWAQPVLVGLGFAVVLPVLALIVGASALGSEIDDGTLVHVLAKPLPRREIILAKLAVAVVVTTVSVAPAMLLVGLLADASVQFALGLVLATALGALAYSAVFLALSVLTRRPVLLGLIYVLVWEGLLTNLLQGARVLSIQHYALAVADRVGGNELLSATVSTPVAVVMALLVTIAATAFAAERLRSFTLAGETS